MPITIDFKGKLVVVTGGGRGIGEAITKALAKAGADIAISYTSRDSSAFAADVSKTYGVKVTAYRCEVTKSADVNQMLVDVERDYGKKVDIGVANAGTSLWKDAIRSTDDDFRRILETNTFGPFYLARALARSWLSLPIDLSHPSESIDVRHMTGVNLNKQILFVSSISGIVGMNPQRQAAYNASKGALTMLSKSLAGEWSHVGIYVNSISPGYVETDMLLNPTTDEERQYAAEWKRRTPVGRFATPDQVGEFIVVMLSEKQAGNGFMAGSDVVLDGGYLVF